MFWWCWLSVLGLIYLIHIFLLCKFGIQQNEVLYYYFLHNTSYPMMGGFNLFDHL